MYLENAEQQRKQKVKKSLIKLVWRSVLMIYCERPQTAEEGNVDEARLL